MVARERINSTCTVFEMNTKYYARENHCGGFNSGPKDTPKEAFDYAITELASSGGSIFAKNIPLPGDVISYGNHILIVAEWKDGEDKWQRDYYRNNTRLRELADPIAVLIDDTFSHPNSTDETDLKVWTISKPVVIHELTLDLSNLTENLTIRVYKKLNGEWRRLLGRTLSWQTSYDVAVPLGTISSITDVKITVQSASLEGASRDIPYSGWQEEWS